MTEPRLADIGHDAFALLIESLNTAANPERELLHRIIVQAGNELGDPERFDHVVRLCAVPRQFDAKVVAALLGGGDHAGESQRLVRNLRTLTFVAPKLDGKLAYHDTVRELLLAEWRDNGTPEEFEAVNSRMIAFYEGEHEDARRMEQDLGAVAGVLHSVNHSRYLQLAAIVESRFMGPLIEALYHGFLSGADAGYHLFEKYFSTYEEQHRLSICASILNAADDFLMMADAGAGGARIARWLRYWRGRLEQAFHRPAAAELILRSLLEEAGDDHKLRLWVLSQLGGVLLEQERVVEARGFFEAELSLSTESREDPYNLPASYARLAELYWKLGQLRLAAETFRTAIRSAANENNMFVGVYGRLHLSSVLLQVGRKEEALEVAFEALDVVRTSGSAEWNQHADVAMRILAIVRGGDPKLDDTLIDEVNGLSREGDPLIRLWYRQTQMQLLQRTGRVRQAIREQAELSADLECYRNTMIEGTVRLSIAIVLDEQGRYREAIELYGRIIESWRDGGTTPWDGVAALSNRGMRHIDSGQLDAAQGDLEAAVDEWGKMGHPTLRAFTRVFMAKCLCAQGRHDEANLILDEACETLVGSDPLYLAEAWDGRGDLRFAQARWREAAAEYRRALSAYRLLGQNQLAVRAMHSLAATLTKQGKWEAAARYGDAANALLRRMSRVDRYKRLDQLRRADADNAQAARLLVTTGSSRPKALRDAHEILRSTWGRVPGNAWYGLKFAYTCAALERWTEAAEALERLLAGGPGWVRQPLLLRVVTGYRLRGAAEQMSRKQFSSAERVCRDLAMFLENFRPEPSAQRDLALMLGGALLSQGAVVESEREYERGLSLASTTSVSVLGFYVRLCLVRLLADDGAKGTAAFKAAYAYWKGFGARAELVRALGECFRLLALPDLRQKLDAALDRLVLDDALSVAQRRSARAISLYYKRALRRTEGSIEELSGSKQSG